MNAAIDALVSHFRLADWIVKPDQKAIERGAQRHVMEPRAMQVLVALCERAGEVLSAEQLLLECWRGTFYGDNPVHKTIAQLRKLLGDSANESRYIATIHKRGYRLIAPVTFPDGYRGAPSQVAVTWNAGSPYVGLRAFDGGHGSVFCGRGRATAQVTAALARQVERGLGFVLLLGASGCGKSSLLQAGVLPVLARSGGANGLQAMSVAHFSPAQAAPGQLLEQFARALGQWQAGGEPVLPAAALAGFAQALGEDPDAALRGVEAMIERRLPPARSIAARPVWVLCVDPLEALLHDGAAHAAELEAFLRVLARLATARHLAVLAACRSDFYPKLTAQALLRELKTGDGQYDVPPLSPGELAQAIRTPAAAAGLSFELDPQNQLRLDDVLRDAAVRHPQALPLLQHALHALYKRRGEGGTLSFAAYADIGGLEGALAHQAEAAFAAATPAARACLPEVLRRLVLPAPDGGQAAGRHARWSQLSCPAAHELVTQLVDARLLVSEFDGGEARFRLAHEALLRHWPRAQEWIQDNQRLLAARARLGAACLRWQQEDCRRDLLLPAGRLLDEARTLIDQPGLELGEDEHRFVQRSRARHRRQQWWRAGGLAAIVLLALAAGVVALFAGRAQQNAEQRRLQAESLLQFMLGDLTEKLRPLGRLDVLDAIGREANDYFSAAASHDDSVDALLLRTRALRQLGEIRYARADTAGAAQAFQQSAALAARVAQPGARAGWEELGIAAFWLGQMRHRERDDAGAHAAWSDYLRASEHLLALAPDDAVAQMEVSYAHNNLGTLEFGRGDFTAARARFEASLEYKQRARALRPDDGTLHAELADTLSWLGSCDEALGALDAASARHRDALDLILRLQRAAPSERLWAHREATLRLHLGGLALMRGELDDAARDYAQASDTLETLAAAQPDHRGWQRDAAFAALQRGWLDALRGEREQALARLQRSAAVLGALVAQDGAAVEWRRLQVIARLRIAQVTGVGAGIDGAPALSDIVADLRALLQAQPQDRNTRLMLAHALVEQGRQLELAAPAGADSGARIAWQGALALLDEALQNEFKALDPRVRALTLLGRRDEAGHGARTLWQAGYREPGFMPHYALALPSVADAGAAASLRSHAQRDPQP